MPALWPSVTGLSFSFPQPDQTLSSALTTRSPAACTSAPPPAAAAETKSLQTASFIVPHLKTSDINHCHSPASPPFSPPSPEFAAPPYSWSTVATISIRRLICNFLFISRRPSPPQTQRLIPVIPPSFPPRPQLVCLPISPQPPTHTRPTPSHTIRSKHPAPAHAIWRLPFLLHSSTSYLHGGSSPHKHRPSGGHAPASISLARPFLTKRLRQNIPSAPDNEMTTLLSDPSLALST